MSSFCVLFVVTLVGLASSMPLHTCRLVELSYDFSPRTVYWPGGENFRITNIVKGIVNDKAYDHVYMEANNYAAAEHGGTHMDAPSHFIAGGKTIDQIPIEVVIGEACVIRVSEKARINRDFLLDVEDIKQWEHRNGMIPQSCIVLVDFGWEDYYPDKSLYFGHEYNVEEFHFPGVSGEAAKYLVTRRIRALGVNVASFDGGKSRNFPAHRFILGAGIHAYENLANLKSLPYRGATVALLPIKFLGGSGAPVRGFAVGWDGPSDPCRLPSSATATHCVRSALLMFIVSVAMFARRTSI